MSYDLAVYSPSKTPPEMKEVLELLDLAGWQCVLLEDLDSMEPTKPGNTALAVGWELSSESASLVQEALESRHRAALENLGEEIRVVGVSVDSGFEFDPEVLAEIQGAGFDPELVDRVRRSTVQYVFSTSAGAPEGSVEFQWALASAVGVCLGGILEDIEEGTFEDCTEDE